MTDSTSPFEPDVPDAPADAGAGGRVETPDLRKTEEALRHEVEIRSLAVLAVLLDFLLSPLIRTLGSLNQKPISMFP